MSLWSFLFGSKKTEPKPKHIRVVRCRHCKHLLEPGKLHACHTGRSFRVPRDFAGSFDFTDFYFEAIMLSELVNPDCLEETGSNNESIPFEIIAVDQSDPKPVPEHHCHEHHHSEPCQSEQTYSEPDRDTDYGNSNDSSSSGSDSCGGCGD